MTTSTVIPTDVHTWKEWRRCRAWDLAQQGWRQRAIATALGVSEGAVSHWLKRARAGGRESLRRRIAPGPPHRLTPEQRAQIPELLAKGAESHGFRGEVWTARRVAAVIERTFGVRYHPTHVSRLLRSLGQSVQQPEVRATQRDPAAVEAWWRERWPTLEKKPRTRSARLSGPTSRASTCCPPACGPTPREDRPRA